MHTHTTEVGHLFVIDGDLQGVALDAWLLPLDPSFSSTAIWQDTLKAVGFRVSDQEFWQENEYARFLATHEVADVWIGNVGRTGLGPDHYARCATDFIRAASEFWRQNNPQKERLPLVGINHLGTGAGGARFTHGEVLKTIIEAISKELEDGTLMSDVVLVSWGDKPAAAAQHTRFNRCSDWKTDPQWKFPYNQEQIHRSAEQLAKVFGTGSSSVFMGAGVSKGAGLLGWDDLLIEVGKKTSPVTTDAELNQFMDPRDKAALLEARLKRARKSIGTELQPFLTASKYSLQHGLLSSLPSSEYITTNVDELFERACRVGGRDIAVIPDKPAGQNRWLLKLHGTVSQPESIVFTRDHFLASFRSSRALIGLVQAMLFTRHMLFVGYGLRDEDFHELVYEVRSAFPEGKLQKKLGTTLALFDDPLQTELWSDLLEVVPMRPSLEGRVPTHAEVGAAARDIERFLDLVGMLSSSRSAFLLDGHYEGVKAENEKAAFAALKPVVKLASSHADDEPGWREVKRLLRDLGAELPK